MYDAKKTDRNGKKESGHHKNQFDETSFYYEKETRQQNQNKNEELLFKVISLLKLVFSLKFTSELSATRLIQKLEKKRQESKLSSQVKFFRNDICVIERINYSPQNKFIDDSQKTLLSFY